MPDSDILFRSATELAAMVRDGEVSSRELVETSLERIEELNPELNAFVEVDAEAPWRPPTRSRPATSVPSPESPRRSRTTGP